MAAPEPTCSRGLTRPARPIRRLLLLVLGALALVGLLSACEVDPNAPAAAGPCTRTWVGPANGSWHVPTSWSPAGVPTAADVVCSGGDSSIRIAQPATAGSTMLSGSLYIPPTGHLTTVNQTWGVINTLILEGSLTTANWTVLIGPSLLGGTLRGSGMVVVESFASAYVAGPLALADQVTIRNKGTLDWSAGAISLCDTARVDNSGTITVTANPAALTDCGTGTTVVTNRAGATVHVSAPGALHIATPFDNEGTVRTSGGGVVTVDQGSSPGADDDGAWLPEGETITFAGGDRRFTYASQIGGPSGTVRLEGGSFRGEARIVGPLHWMGGQLAGPDASTYVMNTSVVADGSPVSLPTGAYVENGGTFTLGTTLSLCGTSLFDNQFLLTMTGPGAAVERCAPGDAPMLANNNMVRAINSAPGRARIAVPFDNHGDVATPTGGKITIADGNSLGENDTGYYWPTGIETISFTGGVREFDSSAELGGPDGSVLLAGASFRGSITLTGLVRWTSGQLAGLGTTVTVSVDNGGRVIATGAAPLSIGPSASIELIGDEYDPVLFTLETTLQMCGNSVIYSDVATLQLANQWSRIERCLPTDAPAIFNGGVVSVVATPGGAATIAVPFDNYDRVTVAGAAKLDVLAGSTPTGFDVGSYQGAGSVNFGGGTRKFYPAVAELRLPATLSGGTFTGGVIIKKAFTWSAGQIVGPGATTTVETNGNLTVTSNVSLPATGVLVNEGTTTVSGSIQLCGAGVTIQNRKQFTLTGSGAITRCALDTSTFANLAGGTLTANPTAGGSVGLAAAVTNAGTIAVTSGELLISGNLVSTGTIDTSVQPTGPVLGRISVVGSATVSGTMKVRFLANVTTPPKSYAVLNATLGVTGTFNTLTVSGLVGPVATLTYLPTSVIVNAT